MCAYAFAGEFLGRILLQGLDVLDWELQFIFLDQLLLRRSRDASSRLATSSWFLFRNAFVVEALIILS